jgi:hypothetical protein
MTDLKPKLRVDVNKNPTKAGIKVQFVLPQTIEGDKKAELTQKLQTKLNQGLGQYNLTISQDTDTPYANVIGFLIPIADIKLLIKKALGMGESIEAAPEETPAPEEPVAEVNRMQQLAGLIKEEMSYEDTDGWMRTYVDDFVEDNNADLDYRDDFENAWKYAINKFMEEQGFDPSAQLDKEKFWHSL